MNTTSTSLATNPGTLPGIDHPLLLVRDIEAARAFCARLGFTVTPVGKHPWGTSTSLAVLQRSALELMGIYDDTLLDNLGTGDFRFGRHMHDALAAREGLALVALHSCDTASDAAGFVARGVASQGQIDFRRKVKPPGGEWDEAVVSLNILLDPALPRVSHFLAQQHKPHLLWVPEWMQHANGAQYIAGVTYLAEDPAPLVARLSAMFANATETPQGWEIATGQGRFRVLRPAQWQAVFGDTPCPVLSTRRDGIAEPGGVAIDIAVADLAAARALVEQAGIALCDTPAGPAVADITATGNAVLRFVQAP